MRVLFLLLLAAVPLRAAQTPALDELRGLSPLQAPEIAAPQASPEDAEDEALRLKLLDGIHGDQYAVPTDLGGILLVVEKGYLSQDQTQRLVFDLRKAVSDIPRLTGRPPLISGRFTVYVYDKGPISHADVPGARPGERGLMLLFVKEGRSPIFHEMTHLLAGYGDSQSLGEGVACAVQARLAPDRPSAFFPANADPDAESRRIIREYTGRRAHFLDGLGEKGDYRFPTQEMRQDFYWASWSFVEFLLRQGTMAQLWRVIDAGGTPESYRAVYGRSYDSLFKTWKTPLSR